jgi:class 3 adenylate cyclase/tetratricopeptide (TPR) repeat protein
MTARNGLTAAWVLKQLAHKDAPLLHLLSRCREQGNEHVWEQGPALHRLFARLLRKQGHPSLALEVAARGLEENRCPGDHELMYLRALALADCGNLTKADDFVQALLALPDLSDHFLTEALSLAGRIRKARSASTPNADLLRDSLAYYERAYKVAGDIFPGINAAALALLTGDPRRSRALARGVRRRAEELLDQKGKKDDAWLPATLGEANLLLGDPTSALGYYRRAVRIARDNHADGEIASMRRQLLLLADHLEVGKDLLSLLHIGPIVVFAGHGLDRPGDPVRFPHDAALIKAVRRAIERELEVLEPSVGYCSPGCGSDILFGELMRERDAELHVVLPFAEADFYRERVDYGMKQLAPWRKRYRKLCGPLRVTSHAATTEEFLDDQVLFDFAGQFLQGLGLARAEQLGVKAVALVVQDKVPHPWPSGVAAFVANWQETGRETRVIDLAELRQRAQRTWSPLPAPKGPRVEWRHRRQVQAMLFADVAGFSGLPESHLPAFFELFLKEVAQELKATPAKFQNTWGDGLYLVFDKVEACAGFALRLLGRLEHFDFKQLWRVLPPGKQPGVRIGLHTGPVFPGHDAVIDKDNYFGSHVSRAARIEPVTPPGCAFVSEQFAAALAVTPGHDFVCEYLGLQPLAKEYDVCPLYRLTRRTDRGLPA